MEPCTPSSSRSNRSRRTDRSRRALRAAAAGGLCALFAAAGAAAWDPAGGPLAPGSPSRAIAAAGLAGLSRLVSPPPHERLVVFTLVGAALLCILLALASRRRREQERLRRVDATLQQARAPQVFEAARATRPLRRGALPDATEASEGDRLTGTAPLLPEVAECAAELRADAVREAAARAVMLRAASERSETRRRAAALRARARLEPGDGSPSVDAAVPTVEVLAAPAPDAARPESKPAPARVAVPQRDLVLLAATNPPRPAPHATAAAAPAPGASTQRSAPPSSPASNEARGTARVTLLHTSGPLTFEWLEHCLARDPQDIQARLDLCTALLVAERFADAERVAREGLERDATNGRLLLRLSEALTGQDRIDEALEIAVRAVRAHRTRKAILHLTRLSAVARRFSAADGARLRKALETRPNDPVFLYALGAFEAQHGDPREALPILRLALRQERSPRWRRVVSREIARLRADELGAAGAKPRRAAG